jgi:hypothetical protein
MELIYWVCTAGDDNRATGHVSVCISCHAPGKPSQKGHRITWIGPFAEKHLALEAASATGRTFDWCYRCRNFTGELPSWLPPSRASEHLHRQVPRVAPDRYQGDQPAGWRRNPGARTSQRADHREIVGDLIDDQQHIAAGSD